MTTTAGKLNWREKFRQCCEIRLSRPVYTQTFVEPCLCCIRAQHKTNCDTYKIRRKKSCDFYTFHWTHRLRDIVDTALNRHIKIVLDSPFFPSLPTCASYNLVYFTMHGILFGWLNQHCSSCSANMDKSRTAKQWPKIVYVLCLAKADVVFLSISSKKVVFSSSQKVFSTDFDYYEWNEIVSDVFWKNSHGFLRFSVFDEEFRVCFIPVQKSKFELWKGEGMDPCHSTVELFR